MCQPAGSVIFIIKILLVFEPQALVSVFDDT